MMTVIRVTSTNAGEVMTAILKRFLAMTQRAKAGLKWKQRLEDGFQWQQYDVIGDFGDNDTVERLGDKVSEWFLSR